jgi:hypothetical protein
LEEGRIVAALSALGQVGESLEFPVSLGSAKGVMFQRFPSLLQVSGDTVMSAMPSAHLRKLLPATFRALDIPAGIIDARNLVYGNEKVTETTVAARSTRDLFRCSAGAGLSLGQYRIQFGITAQPRRLPSGGAELFLQTAAFGRLVSGNQSGTTQCVSNGVLDLKIREQMDIELARIGT